MGELIDSNISVSIDGKRLFSFKSLKLHQSINDHHSFELRLTSRPEVTDMSTISRTVRNGLERRWLSV